MPDQPFLPAVVSGQAGKTVSITIGAGSATSHTVQIDSTGRMNPSILVVGDGGNNTIAYLRMSVESSTTITATSTDTPFPFGTLPTVRIFANPAPSGICNIAVVVTVTPTNAGTVWFVPGEGGIM